MSNNDTDDAEVNQSEDGASRFDLHYLRSSIGLTPDEPSKSETHLSTLQTNQERASIRREIAPMSVTRAPLPSASTGNITHCNNRVIKSGGGGVA